LFLIIIVINGFILCAIQIFARHRIENKDPTALACLIFSVVIEICFVISIARQPKTKKSLYFEVSSLLLI